MQNSADNDKLGLTYCGISGGESQRSKSDSIPLAGIRVVEDVDIESRAVMLQKNVERVKYPQFHVVPLFGTVPHVLTQHDLSCLRTLRTGARDLTKRVLRSRRDQ